MALPTIPPRYVPGIQHLISLDDEIIDLIIHELKTVSPCVNMNNLATSIQSKNQRLATEDIEELLNTVVAFYSLHQDSNASIEEFVRNISDAISRTELLSENFVNKETVFSERLTLFLKLDEFFGLIAKTIEVMTEQNSLYLNSRILTDIRPVFKMNSEQDIAGAIIIHNIKIEYRQNGEIKEFFVTLDNNDIEQLQQQLNREIKKTSAIQKFMRDSNLDDLNKQE